MADEDRHEHRHEHHKFDPAWAQRLLSPERERLLPPAAILELLEAGPGQTAADIGCGPGFLSLPLARAVAPGGGRVLACDISPEMLAMLRRRAEEAGIAALETFESGESSLPLPDASCDRVLLVCLLHELAAPAAFLGEVRRVLRPGGRGLAVDWQARESPFGPPLRSRVPADQAREWLEAAGLSPEAAADVGPHSYGIVFHGPAGA